jgi:hypothetical protein
MIVTVRDRKALSALRSLRLLPCSTVVKNANGTVKAPHDASKKTVVN